MFDEALIGIVETISTTMFGVDAALTTLANSSFDEHAITATITFRGNFAGELRATLTTPLARTLTALMLHEPLRPEDDSDLRDAVGELANIIAGNLKGLVPAPCHLSLPHVQRGSQVSISYPSVLLGRALFVLFGEPMWVELARTQGLRRL
jgi:chemotaxis protein CheX